MITASCVAKPAPTQVRGPAPKGSHASRMVDLFAGSSKRAGLKACGQGQCSGLRWISHGDTTSIELEQVGGFDAARLMIGHSDINLCLRLRDLDRTILYCPAIQAIHHEGATRGRNETQTETAWDEAERMDLVKRWGNALSDDPGVSPYCRRGERPFAFLREPTMREILAHIDRSASADPWRPTKGQSVPHHATDMA